MERSAIISECERYRYELFRCWDPALPCLYWVMLNPSKADAQVDDPTVRKCIGFARFNGYGSIRILNMSAFRATDPKDLIDRQGFVDVVGPKNHDHLRAIPRDAVVVCGWGSFVEAQPRLFHWVYLTRKLLEGCTLKCVRITKTQPWHPLYVPYGPLVDLKEVR